MEVASERGRKRARVASSSCGCGRGANRAEFRLDALPDELLVHIIRAIGLTDVLICRPHHVCRRLRGVLRTIVWDELDLAPSEAEIRARAAAETAASDKLKDLEPLPDLLKQFNASHMRRLKRVLASLHPDAGFAAWGSARALRLRFSFYGYEEGFEEVYTAIEIASSLALASPSIVAARVEFREPSEDERQPYNRFFGWEGLQREVPRIDALLAVLSALPNLARLEFGEDIYLDIGFFSWRNIVGRSKSDSALSAALAPLTSLQHLSVPCADCASDFRPFLALLPALRSLRAALSFGKLPGAAPLFAGSRLERLELTLKDECPGTAGAAIGLAGALEALADCARAPQIVRVLEIPFDVTGAANSSPDAAGRFFAALGRLTGLEKLSLTVSKPDTAFLCHAAPLERLTGLKEALLSLHGISARLDSEPLVKALASLPGLTVDLEVAALDSGDLEHAVNVAARLRPKLRLCTIVGAAEIAGVRAVAALPPWPGLTLRATLEGSAPSERPALVRSLAGALAAAGRLELRFLASSDTDLACLPLLAIAPLRRRLRLQLEIDELDDYQEANMENERLTRTARAMLRGFLPASDWSVMIRARTTSS
eukprot:tig00020805_g13999.t1